MVIKNSIGRKNGLLRKRNGRSPQPAWEVAMLFPEQGGWTAEDYLDLPGNRLVELANGRLEILPMPTTFHQWTVFYLWRLLTDFVSKKNLGLALGSPLPVRLETRKFREPDIVFMLQKNRKRARNQFWQGADLVMEVVSDDPKGRERDLVTKKKEYARAGISEYWIVDPKRKRITVLRLHGNKYKVDGTYRSGQHAQSRLLRGFEVDVTDALAGPPDTNSQDNNETP